MKLKILIIGSGAREHCLADKLSQSPKVAKIYCAPGNGGTAQLGENVEIKVGDIEGLLKFALSEKIGLTVVGPEIPLAEGIVDKFRKEGLKIFGPNKELAKLESSKVFAKKMMQEFEVPTADFEIFTSPQEAKKYIAQRETPIVVKADGLAAGKGVIVCQNKKEANSAVDVIMVDKKFGESGRKIIIEDCLKGQEFSVLVFTDGDTIIPLVGSQDHKRALDGDRGPNTGGMGAYAPTPLLEKERLDKIIKNIFYPLVKGLSKKGKKYKGMLYAGLMVDKDQIYVLEFNVRFGDPEAQAILPKMNTDLLELILKTIEGDLKQVSIEWDSRFCVCVVLASGGYPGNYQKGKEIKGIKEAEREENILVYHAGTKLENGKILTDGGRVLSVVGLGDTIKEAKDKAYQAVSKISFAGMQFRTDIGDKALVSSKSNVQSSKSN